MSTVRQGAAALGERTLALILAGGDDARLGGLTRREPAAALPFGGEYRCIDVPLSSCLNSGVGRVAVLAQHGAQPLLRHVRQGAAFARLERGRRVEVWPSPRRPGDGSRAATADAVYRNVETIERLAPDLVLVLGGERVCRMDYRALLDTHVASGLGATVGCVEVPIASARDVGVVALDARNRVAAFADKPLRPWSLPDDADNALASLDVYAFDREWLVDCLAVDARDPTSSHDFGRDVLPLLINANGVAAHVFRDPRTGRRAYWRDVGTLDGYYAANLELLDEPPALDLHDTAWPLWAQPEPRPPPQFVGAGHALRSIVSAGCRIAGRVEHSVLSPDCRIEQHALVSAAVVLPGATLGAGCRVRNAIVAAACSVPAGTVIGEDRAADAARFQVSPGGVTLVTPAALERADRDSRSRERVA